MDRDRSSPPNARGSLFGSGSGKKRYGKPSSMVVHALGSHSVHAFVVVVALD